MEIIKLNFNDLQRIKVVSNNFNYFYSNHYSRLIKYSHGKIMSYDFFLKLYVPISFRSTIRAAGTRCEAVERKSTDPGSDFESEYLNIRPLEHLIRVSLYRKTSPTPKGVSLHSGESKLDFDRGPLKTVSIGSGFDRRGYTTKKTYRLESIILMIVFAKTKNGRFSIECAFFFY